MSCQKNETCCTHDISLKELVKTLYHHFAGDKVDVDEVKRCMRSYHTKKSEWEKYAIFDKSKKYTRNLLDDGNGKFNLLVLCWNEGQGSPIHDHTNSHCVMKILDGAVKETLYKWPSSEHKEDKDVEVIEENIHKTDEVAYIHDNIGLHRVENPSHVDGAVTLHLYFPPFDMCQTFDDRTGIASTCQIKPTKDFRSEFEDGASHIL